MKKDYGKIADQIIKLVGGKENISNVMHCYTRLRLNLKDTSIVNLDEIKKLDVLGAQYAGEQLQIIIGNEVKDVYEEVCQKAEIALTEMIDEEINENVNEKKEFNIKNIFNNIIDVIVGCIIPILPILIGSGIIKAVILIAQQAGWLAAASPTAITLGFVADSAFYFMPVFVGFFAAKKFGANLALGAMIGAALLHPTFTAMVTNQEAMSVFGLPIYPASYSSTIIPVILSVWIMSYVEKLISKYSPKSIRTILEPTLTLLIMTPLTLCAIAPLGVMFSSGLGNLFETFYNVLGPIAVAVLCSIMPFVVMVGMHVGVIPISIQAIASTGFDKFIMPTFFMSNFAQGAACLGVGVKSKQADLKSFAFSSAFSSIVPGISEPGMYGITLKYKTPMWAAMSGAFVGGLYFGFMGVGQNAFVPPNIFAITTYMFSTNNLIHTIIGIAIAMIVTFVMTMIIYKEKPE
ncbi:PTS transporter subunit EIIC [Longibaculum muris]|uniref:PTS transporter subunit EIIC n=1 Tax=Longibaculum muris TaxID=1796628 RepID=UPI0018A0BCAD|nr:PTS transporter subunit EIIC [Longibaculum muris]